VTFDETNGAARHRQGPRSGQTDDASTNDGYVDSNQSPYIIRKS
jgi:hypothetical protein